METFSQSDYEIIEKAKQELDREHEEALDKLSMGKELPLDESMKTSIERIKQSIQAAKREGSEAGAREKLILCADEAKNMECDILHTLFKNLLKC
jgi:hypothetical protein